MLIAHSIEKEDDPKIMYTSAVLRCPSQSNWVYRPTLIAFIKFALNEQIQYSRLASYEYDC